MAYNDSDSDVEILSFDEGRTYHRNEKRAFPCIARRKSRDGYIQVPSELSPCVRIHPKEGDGQEPVLDLRGTDLSQLLRDLGARVLPTPLPKV